MTQSVCQDTPHCYYTFITSRHDWPVQLEQQPHTFPHQPLFHRCSLSNIQCQQLQCQGGQFVCFQWPLRIKRGIWTNSPLGQRGWNNHHTLHGGNHLMLKPLDPLIPEAKLSHTVITSAPFLLLDLQCVCVCVCLKWSSFKSFTSYRQEMWLWAQEYAITLGLFTAPLYARPHYQTSTQHSVECKPPTGPDSSL